MSPSVRWAIAFQLTSKQSFAIDCPSAMCNIYIASTQCQACQHAHCRAGGASNGGDAAAGELSAAEVQAKVGAHTVITALQPPQAAVEAMATLQISLHQVPLVWDTLLWAAGLAPADVGTGQQREMAELLKCRILHRSLVSLLEPPKHGVSSAQGSEDLGEDDEDEDDAGGDGAVKLPDNKVWSGHCHAC